MTSAELAHAAWKVKAEAHEKRAATIAAARKVADDAAAEAQAAEQRAQAWDTRQALLSSPSKGPEPEEPGAAEVPPLTPGPWSRWRSAQRPRPPAPRRRPSRPSPP